MARKPAPFNLTVNDQLELESWLRTSTLSQNLVHRARIVLALDAGEAAKDVAERLETTTACVFQTKVATDSRRSLPPIPRESCH